MKETQKSEALKAKADDSSESEKPKRFPDRTAAIEFFRESARKFRERGDYPKARSSYFRWVEYVRQQNINTRGQLEGELENAQREYSDFVKSDPLYQEIRDVVIEEIKRQPGILQTDLYKVLTNYNKSDIQYALYFADDHGVIVRKKKGRTYIITLPS